MAVIQVWAKSGIANWNDADEWHTHADGVSGSDVTNPQNTVDDTYECNLNGRTVVANVNITVDLIEASGSAGHLITDENTRVITADIIYAGTLTAGMVRVAAGALTINGKISRTSSGYAVVMSGSGSLTVNNVGATALETSGTSGRGIQTGGTGNFTLNGNIIQAGSGSTNYAVFIEGSGTNAINGNLTVTNTGRGVYLNSGTAGTPHNLTFTGNVLAQVGIGIMTASGVSVNTLTIIGEMRTEGSGTVLWTGSSGTVIWRASYTLAAEESCRISHTVGTLVLANGDGRLNITNNGSFAIHQYAAYGMPSITITGGGNTAQVVNQSALAGGVVIGGTAGEKALIVGPVIPDEEDVLRPADGGPATYGYAGDLLTGTAEAGGGGYTYGSENAAHVLTTAGAGAGTYIPVAAADVRFDTAVGVDPAKGTCYVPTAANVVDGVNVDATTGTYPTTATTQAADAAILEAEKAFLLATKTITFGASSVIGTLAVANVLEAVTGGTYHAPDQGEVIHTATFGPDSGTAGTYDITNVSAGNIKDGVTIGGVEGTYDPMAAAIFPTEANVSTAVTAYGPTGSEYTGLLDLGDYTLISAVVDEKYVLTGHDNYTDGEAGTLTIPAVGDVRDGVEYGVVGELDEGTLTLPIVGHVQDGVMYGAGGTEFEGELETSGITLGDLTTALDARGITVPTSDTATSVARRGTEVETLTTLATAIDGVSIEGMETAMGTVLDARGVTEPADDDENSILRRGVDVVTGTSIEAAVDAVDISLDGVETILDARGLTEPGDDDADSILRRGDSVDPVTGTTLAAAIDSIDADLGATAPEGWINAAAFATNALAGQDVKDVLGKVIGGGSGTITGIGTRADARAWAGNTDAIRVINSGGQDYVAVALGSGAIGAGTFETGAITAAAISAAAAAKIAGSTILITTTIAVAASQTSFTLHAGSADDDAYNGCIAVITDQSTGTQKCIGGITDYTGATKTVTLDVDPGIFTFEAGDNVEILPKMSLAFIDGEGATALDSAIDANITKILDTAITETSAGYLAAAFKKLFDVETPALTVGTNPPADWLNADAIKADAVTKIIDAITDAAPGVTGTVDDETASTTVFVTNLSQTEDDFFGESFVLFTSGQNRGVSRKMAETSSYNGTTKAITVEKAFPFAPANEDEFIILGRSE